MENIQLAFEKLMNNKKENVSKEEGIAFFNEELDQLLGLDLIGCLEREQTGGHCKWLSTLYSLWGLLFLEKFDRTTELTYESFKEAAIEINLAFLDFKNHDAKTSLLRALPVLRKYDYFGIDPNHLYSSLILRCLEDDLDMPLAHLISIYIPNLDWVHPETRKSLIRCVYENDFMRLSLISLSTKKNLNLDLLDANNETFFDDVRKKPIPEDLRERLDPAFLELLEPYERKIELAESEDSK